jgi:hypothetical protein
MYHFERSSGRNVGCRKTLHPTSPSASLDSDCFLDAILMK